MVVAHDISGLTEQAYLSPHCWALGTYNGALPISDMERECPLPWGAGQGLPLFLSAPFLLQGSLLRALAQLLNVRFGLITKDGHGWGVAQGLPKRENHS